MVISKQPGCSTVSWPYGRFHGIAWSGDAMKSLGVQSLRSGGPTGLTRHRPSRFVEEVEKTRIFRQRRLDGSPVFKVYII